MTTLIRINDATLDAIVRAIVGRFHPSRIILFGSRARGDATPDSDYDLMVEMESAVGQPETIDAVETAARAASGGKKVDIVVRRPAEFEKRRNDVGYLDYDVAHDGIVVYPHTSTAYRLSTRPAARVREGRAPDGSHREEPGTVEGWIERATEDVLTIRGLLTAEFTPWSAVCFHGQQAAEKYLKALFIRRGIRPPRTHDLVRLLGMARSIGYRLPELDAACAALTPYAVDARYPDEMPLPAEPAGRQAARMMDLILDATAGEGCLPRQAPTHSLSASSRARRTPEWSESL